MDSEIKQMCQHKITTVMLDCAGTMPVLSPGGSNEKA
jgi:hypothetical protein